MDEKRVRISDIAEELGLSTATVSNVLHGKTKKISDETVRRVQALLEKRQYVPSMAGILLAQNSSRIIGIIVNDHEKYESHTLDDVFIATSLNFLSEEIEKSGQFMMIKKTTSPEEIIKFASMWNLDGMVLIGFCDEDYMYLRNHMRIPFVVYDGYCDNAQRIYNDNCICVDKERYDGFCEGFGKENCDFMLIPMKKSERLEFYHKNLDSLRNYTAVFAVSDFYAIEFMHFLQENGISVPDEISVAGFDDTPMCTLVSPTLTSVKQDMSLRAKIAVEKLRELKERKEAETTIMLPVTLIERKSTKHINER